MKRAVIGHAQNSSANPRADRIALDRIQPRVGRQLLEAQRNPLLLFVELQHLDLNLIAHIHQVAGMRKPSPGHIGDMQQAIDPAEVDKCAVVGEVLDRPGQDRSLRQVLQRLVALGRLLLFQDFLARDDHVAALLV